VLQASARSRAFLTVLKLRKSSAVGVCLGRTASPTPKGVIGIIRTRNGCRYTSTLFVQPRPHLGTKRESNLSSDMYRLPTGCIHPGYLLEQELSPSQSEQLACPDTRCKLKSNCKQSPYTAVDSLLGRYISRNAFEAVYWTFGEDAGEGGCLICLETGRRTYYIHQRDVISWGSSRRYPANMSDVAKVCGWGPSPVHAIDSIT
jgi:hypothetical protein